MSLFSRWGSRPLALPMLVVCGAALAAVTTQNRAVAAPPEDTHAAERCRNTIAISLAGRLPLAEESAVADKSAYVNALLTQDDFRVQFASFLMRELNNVPSEEIYKDSLYVMAQDVLKKGRPWSALFKGQLAMLQSPATGRYYIGDDANGLGYFRTPGWIRRYAGNEADGVRLTAAYRILNNLTGVRLTALNNANLEDVSATGRKSAHCRGCHYDGWAPLDPVASILGTRRGIDLSVEILPPPAGASAVIAGHTVKNDRELVELLVGSNDYLMHMCTLMFKYAYGRTPTSCEAPPVDQCISTLKATDSAQKALHELVMNGGFCS